MPMYSFTCEKCGVVEDRIIRHEQIASQLCSNFVGLITTVPKSDPVPLPPRCGAPMKRTSEIETTAKMALAWNFQNKGG